MPAGEDRDELAAAPRRGGAAILAFALVVMLTAALAAFFAGAAQAKVVRVEGRAYGVMPAPGTPQATAGLPLSPTAPATSTAAQSPVTYGGGGLMLSSTLYLIFWGPEGSFPASYTAPIVQYAKDLQADEALTTDAFSVAELYGNSKGEHISGNVTFGGQAFDTTTYPGPDEAKGCKTSSCLSGAQIQTEIKGEIFLNGWPKGDMDAEYLLYTPQGVTVCIQAGTCTASFGPSGPEGFCAYHSQTFSNGIHIEYVGTYSVLPFMPLCDPGQAPAGTGGDANVDGTLNLELHELTESATDPGGSGYLDGSGFEIADKCVYPQVNAIPGLFGPLLGGNPSGGNAFNQLIDGHSYYTQDVWSNQAGCIPRIGPTPSFAVSTPAYASQPVTFDGSGSFDVSTPITTYEWSFGDGSPPDTTSGVSATHTYAQPGAYQVSLTATDGSGPQNASTQTSQVTIATAPPEPAPEEGGAQPAPTPSGGEAPSSGGSSPQSPGSGESSPQTPSPGEATPAPKAKPAVLTRAQKLARALKACHRLTGRRRARCIAAAKKRYGPRHKHRRRYTHAQP